MNSRRPSLVVLTILLLSAAATARADDEGLGEFLNEYNVYSPYVVQGQSEFEFRAAQYRDGSTLVDGSRGLAMSFAHAFTDWWKPEVYFGKYERDPRLPNTLTGYEFENTFQLAPQGEYWADPGFLLSYEYASHVGEANKLEFGPLLEKQTGRLRQRLNLVWEKGLGAFKEDNGYELRGAYAFNYLWRGDFAPGLDVFAHPRDDIYQAGPSAAGEWHIGSGEIEYDAGLLFKLGDKGPDTTLILRLEYEFF